MYVSILFWAAVPLVLLLYNLTRGWLQNAILLLASYALYAYFAQGFLLLLVFSTTATFLIARGLRDPRSGRLLFVGGIILNVGVLGLFKYAGFFASSISAAFGQPASSIDPIFLNLLLPLGISFYSFRLLSYIFDVRSGRLQASQSWLDFALYVAFFPQIASGPIERAAQFLPALRQTRRLTMEQFSDGLTYLAIGIFYKIAIANMLAASTIKPLTASTTAADALLTMLLYSIQLYADFAGYSAMAVGLSLWFALPATNNFRQPYFSRSITEFWTRWHISLSSWFRDYLFFPLSRALLRRLGARRTRLVQVVSYMVTMLVTGLWHGAAWIFVAWGGLHGLFLTAERFFSRPASIPDGQPWWRRIRWLKVLLSILVTQAAVTAAWVFFRAPSIGEALGFFVRLAGPMILTPQWWASLLTPLAMLLLIDGLQAWAGNIGVFWEIRLVYRVGLAVTLIVLVIIFGGPALAPFVYYQF